jgi:hypothetical protein
MLNNEKKKGKNTGKYNRCGNVVKSQLNMKIIKPPTPTPKK